MDKSRLKVKRLGGPSKKAKVQSATAKMNQKTRARLDKEVRNRKSHEGQSLNA